MHGKKAWATTQPGSTRTTQGYRLGDAQMQFQINVQVSVANALTNSTQTLVLSPSTPSVISAAGNVSAVLLGDLASYTSSPNFGYSILMIPSPAGKF
jgi:hypothetical protein